MHVSVVILNWNTREYLERFLPPLLDSIKGMDAEVVVADSASTDGSLDMVAERFPQVRRIPLEQNFGFTGGYNKALSELEADYFLLLNSDIEVPQGWLQTLVDWMDSHPECGACGPKLHSWYERDKFEYAGAAGGYIDLLGYTFCRGRVMKRVETDRGQYDSPRDVLWVSGACLMIRSSLWKELGGLDDRFFAHMEEIDLCWRCWNRGWKVTVVPQSVVYHLGGGTLPQDSPWKLQLNFRNNLLLLHNNIGPGPTLWLRYLLDLGSAAVYLATGHKDYFDAVVTAHRQFRQLRYQGQACKRGRVTGCLRLFILPLAFIKGEGIFEYIRNYENSH